MNIARYALTALALAATTGFALATPNTMHRMHNSMAKTTLNINMGEQNKSKQNGTAMLKQQGANIMVKVSVYNEPKGASEMAHIHKGTCQKLNPTPYKPLKNVMNGTSTSTITGMTIDQLKDGHYAVNVHDAKNPKRYVSCGNI
ncbi:MAG: CHRD domain-containing protein [Candidatus Eremiobacteraeota bacterium]|nr:CHRD domain-containing protein [Candidatus Eremiobacteraeota bacterium]